MQTRLELLRLIGNAIWNSAGAAIGIGSVSEALPEASRLVWDSWSRNAAPDQRRLELEGLVRAAPEDLRRSVSQLVLELLPSEPLEVRQSLSNYLLQAPATFRQALRRPGDPTGRAPTLAACPQRADDLLAFLPTRLARFKVGESPLPGMGWELDDLLGVGGFGEIWKARHPDLTTAAAATLKFCLDPPSAKVLQSQARLLDRLLTEVHHPGIVALRQMYLNTEPPCLVYEYIAGGDLVGLIRDWHRSGRGPTPEQATQIIRRLARIVAFAHQLDPPLVHRDLKPANVLVGAAANNKLIFRVANFGNGDVAASHAIRQTLRGATQAQLLVAAARGSCTPLYASPQQMHGSDPDPRDDVHALGVIWHQILTGNLAMGRPTDPTWQEVLKGRGMAQSLVELMAACFADNPADRPGHAGVLLDRIAAAIRGDDSSVQSPWLDTGGGSAQPLQRRIVNSVGMTLNLIGAGEFRMGSTVGELDRGNDEGPQHDVSLAQPFYIGIYPVTQQQYEAVMGQNPSHFNEARGGGRDFPVETISWDEANEFCRRLSALPSERQARRSYRLPTEAEWECACRGGVGMPFSSGLTLTSREANFNGNYPYGIVARGPYLERTSRVGSYPPNPFGLFDMHGNVWEWCQDHYDRCYYRNSPRDDPQGPPQGIQRVVRGGSCFNIGRFCRSAYRLGIAPGNRNLDVGMRVVMVPGQ
jgi:formylglycine-generating enzyme required for sulfatase activity